MIISGNIKYLNEILVIENMSFSNPWNKNQIKSEDILPKSNWYKKFEKYWEPSEQKAHEYLDNFVQKNILNYGLDRDFPSIKGTSLLSPYIRNGQINVEIFGRGVKN